MAPVVADWSELPKELLNLISERLDHEFDLIRFRSVCSNWRSSSSSSSSSIPNHHNNILSFNFPLLKPYLSTTDSIFLSKRSIFLIKPQQQNETPVSPWLIRVIQNSSGKKKLFQSSLVPFQLPSTFSLDLTKFSVLHFGTDFVVDEPLVQRYGVPHPKKVVYVSPLILAILSYNDDIDMVLFRCGDEYWTDIPDISDTYNIRDICIFKRRIYAVELSCKTFTVELEDLSVRLVAKKTPELDRLKFLVESDGELLLVNISEMLDCDDDLTFKDALWVDVFKLDEKKKKWVTLTSLGDRVLFLGDGCSFSASASDLSVAEGNCIIFMDDVFNDGRICDSGMCVYHLDPGQLSPLYDYPDYLNLFRPPAKLIRKGGMRKTKKRAKQRKRA